MWHARARVAPKNRFANVLGRGRVQPKSWPAESGCAMRDHAHASTEGADEYRRAGSCAGELVCVPGTSPGRDRDRGGRGESSARSEGGVRRRRNTCWRWCCCATSRESPTRWRRIERATTSGGRRCLGVDLRNSGRQSATRRSMTSRTSFASKVGSTSCWFRPCNWRSRRVFWGRRGRDGARLLAGDWQGAGRGHLQLAPRQLGS